MVVRGGCDDLMTSLYDVRKSIMGDVWSIPDAMALWMAVKSLRFTCAPSVGSSPSIAKVFGSAASDGKPCDCAASLLIGRGEKGVDFFRKHI